MNLTELHKLVPRNAAKKLRNFLSSSKPHSSVALIEGPRQVGKTTLVLETLKEFSDTFLVSINLEKDLNAKREMDQCTEFSDFTTWLADTYGFDPAKKQILFIDEAQESLKLGSFVRFMKEEWSQSRVILTGSMMHRLFREGVRYPVGRVLVFPIQPFTFFEFLSALGREAWIPEFSVDGLKNMAPSRHEKILGALDEYLHVGGLPQVVSDYLDKKDSRATLTEIFEDYRNDFVRVFGEKMSSLFEKALQAVADHAGSSSLHSHAVLPSEPLYKETPGAYARLEAWRMIHLSLQRGFQPEGSTNYHPKRYLFDTGLLHFLRTLGVPPLKLAGASDPAIRQALGGIFENAAAIHLVSLGQRLCGWKRDSAGMEIDFITRFGDKTIPLECKANLKTKENHLAGLKKYMQDYKLDTGVLVNAAPFEIREYSFGKIIICPLYAIESLPQILDS